MIIQPFSDLHLDFDRYRRDFPVHEETDVVVYAGDLGENINKNFEWMARQLNGKTAVYVLGNHEFYNGVYENKINRARELSIKYPNIHFLNENFITINEVNFFGSTLWTNFFNDPTKEIIGNMYMNDFHCIKIGEMLSFKAHHSVTLHNNAAENIGSFLTYHNKTKNVVVTHHAPSARSINIKYKGDPLNAAFYSDLDYMFDYNPKLWIHGHMHDACHYVAERTQVVCNPGGYITHAEEYGINGFNPNMLIKI